MAQTLASSPPAASNKRGSTRITRAAQPPLKKVKASETPLPASPSAASPSVQSPPPAPAVSKLPTRLADCRPLPTLSTPQPVGLPASTHQSLAESAVLQASLDRSRLRWIHHGVFDRYWTKPESGKHARPPPPNNPEAKWMKHRGPCRLRVEPHIFECEVYVEEKPKPALQKVPPQQYGQGGYGGYGQQYRPGQQGPAYGQQRPLPAVQQSAPIRQCPAPTPHRPQQSTPQQAEKKPGPDPVISMLASRASSDPELKALMKEVATGAASPSQLKVFQGHIDDLTKIINEKKKEEEEDAAAAEAKKAQEQRQDAIQYDGAADQRPSQPSQPSPAYRPPQMQPAWPTPPPPAMQPHTPPPPPATPPVILQFTTPGATEDRFLFPPKSIVESLSPQHLLCSTLITRKGRDSAEPWTLDADTEYFQPVTFMVEVAYGRESLIELVKKFVKPAEEVRKWMEDTMQRCTRAPDAHLALRLPVKGTEGAETEEERLEAESKIEAEMKKRGGDWPGFGGFRVGGASNGHGGSNVKYVKKPGPKKGEGGRPPGIKNGEGGGKRAGSANAAKGAAVSGATVQPATETTATAAAAQPSPAPAASTETPSGKNAAHTGDTPTAGPTAAASDPGEKVEASSTTQESKETAPAAAQAVPDVKADGEAAQGGAGRPKRAVRKSVRISDV